jgi:uncharacterized membrane protein YGL010W
MALFKLDRDWTDLMDRYQADHQNPVNQACHKVGIPLILGSLPVAMSIVGLPVAAAMFTVGWGFQFVGHAFEGKKPSFVGDKRQLVVGALWWFQKVGMPLAQPAALSATPSPDVEPPLASPPPN